MELLNPRITLQNTDSPYWLVSFEQQFSEHEALAVTLKVPRQPAAGIGQLQDALLQQLITLLRKMLASSSGTTGAAGTP